MTLETDLSLQQEGGPDGIYVFLWRTGGAQYGPADLAAEFPDGTIVPAISELEGRRLGFGRALPPGTWILLRGKRTWGPVESE